MTAEKRSTVGSKSPQSSTSGQVSNPNLLINCMSEEHLMCNKTCNHQDSAGGNESGARGVKTGIDFSGIEPKPDSVWSNFDPKKLQSPERKLRAPVAQTWQHKPGEKERKGEEQKHQQIDKGKEKVNTGRSVAQRKEKEETGAGEFQHMIDEYELWEMQTYGGRYTWNNKQIGLARIYSKLDRVLKQKGLKVVLRKFNKKQFANVEEKEMEWRQKLEELQDKLKQKPQDEELQKMEKEAAKEYINASRIVMSFWDELKPAVQNGKWMVNGGREYTASRGYQWLRGQGEKFEAAPIIWSKFSVPKHSLISWLAWRGRLLTCDKLEKMQVAVDDPTCILCNKTRETGLHLFFACTFSQQLVNLIRKWLGIRIRDSLDRCVDARICFSQDGKDRIAKQIIDEVDEVKQSIKFRVIEADLMELYKTLIITDHVDTNGEDNLITWTLDYQKREELGPHQGTLLN
ncbi:OLC1v1015902C1 [Oldenlandia corymbosa var. corymbosa]|uniref:OLC1v1015902C1 n=1 Tax=Oldenlandia corymbosa var. corymbosa TaxID=529605 RepID=A0AAV1E737_OLDCO|nr:OLC1v1015902C1 [Oldenlandia corymbosa var. corymbosa]